MARVTLKSAVYLGEKEEAPSEKGGRPWKHDAYSVTLECDGRTFETPWKQGIGHRKPRTVNGFGGRPIPPKAEDVLASLIMDASGTEETFADWCMEHGYETDSRRALETYLTCQDIGRRLGRFLADTDWGERRNAGDDCEDIARSLCSTEEPAEA